MNELKAVYARGGLWCAEQLGRFVKVSPPAMAAPTSRIFVFSPPNSPWN
jgi:hypothetical protein